MEHARILALIHETAPALVANGDDLTQHFYHHLFAHHPELQPAFNMVNQARGTQARSLFNALVSFITKFDQLDTLSADARRIAAKHVSLEVQPEQYAVVGASLLATIRERLGAAATPEVMHAWELAYGRIAQLTAGLEENTYQRHRTQLGGWNGFKPFVVTKVVQESQDVRSFYLVPADGQPLPHYQPGQYVSVSVQHLPYQQPYQAHHQIRQYSLSDAPHQPYFRITVKREAGAEGIPAGQVSNHLYHTLRLGAQLPVHAPVGEFCLDPHATTPVALIAGGVGITPLMAMLEHLLHTGSPRPVALIHAVRDLRHHPFRHRQQVLLREHAATLRALSVYQFLPVEVPADEPHFLPDHCASGFLMADHLDAVLAGPYAGAEVYCCGPLGFMRHVKNLLSARPNVGPVHFELFGPTLDV